MPLGEACKALRSSPSRASPATATQPRPSRRGSAGLPGSGSRVRPVPDRRAVGPLADSFPLLPPAAWLRISSPCSVTAVRLHHLLPVGPGVKGLLGACSAPEALQLRMAERMHVPEGSCKCA